MAYGRALCLGMLIVCLVLISFTLLAWCTCHAIIAIWGLLYLKVLILCLTIFTIAVLISLAMLGALAMLMGAFMSCNAYFMPYYIYYSL